MCVGERERGKRSKGNTGYTNPSYKTSDCENGIKMKRKKKRKETKPINISINNNKRKQTNSPNLCSRTRTLVELYTTHKRIYINTLHLCMEFAKTSFVFFLK